MDESGRKRQQRWPGFGKRQKKAVSGSKDSLPRGYAGAAFLCILALLFPGTAFLAYTVFIDPVPNSAFLLLGLLGAFIIGFALVNIVSERFFHYSWPLGTAVCIAVGGFLVTISCLLLYREELRSQLDEQLGTFYFVTLLFCFFLLFPCYCFYRHEIYGFLCVEKSSKSRIKKLMKGKKNFWWYAAINKTFDLGPLYYINKLLTILYPIFCLLILALGWIRFLVPVIAAMLSALCLLSAAMGLAAMIRWNYAKYGTPVIFLRRTPGDGVDSSLFQIIWIAAPIAVLMAEWKMYVSLIL